VSLENERPFHVSRLPFYDSEAAQARTIADCRFTIAESCVSLENERPFHVSRLPFHDSEAAQARTIADSRLPKAA
jgi:hypothetical protein